MRALVISYAFPPVGGAGVQRMLKLVKYLPQHGILPTVLTAENPSVPLSDRSLLDEIPRGVEVVRTRTLEPSYAAKERAWSAASHPGQRSKAELRAVALAKSLLVPDPQVLWVPGAALALSRRLFRSRPDDVVLISGPPFSQFALAVLARLHRGTAIVLDYRDEWVTTRTTYEMASGRSSRVDAALESALLHCAHAITTATAGFRDQLLARFPFLLPERVVVIENGYDPADLPQSPPSPTRNRFVLTHVGTVFRLTSAAGLLDAVRRLREREPELARPLRVRFVGRIVETEAAHFVGSEAMGVEQVGYVEHARAVEELARSNVALCLLDDVEGAERIYPAKIFEVMLLRRPCLALCPEGLLADLVRRHQLGQVAPPRDAGTVSEVIASMLRAHRDGAFPRWSSPCDTQRFDRRAQAAEFARVMRDALRIARAA